MSEGPRQKKARTDGKCTFFVGACGFGDDAPRCIQRYHLSLSDGKLSSAGPAIPVEAGENPGWLEWQPPSRFMYCAFEDAPGKVQAFRYNEADASLQPVGEAHLTHGRHPAHLALDMTRRWVFAANYTEGSISVLPIHEDGSVGKAVDSKAHQGGDLIPTELADRQEKPHCHQVLVHRSNKWVAVSDLGLSAVFIYAFDVSSGSLMGAADDPRHLKLAANAGCRHAAWNEAGTILYVNNELDTSITACAFDVETGTLEEIETFPTLPEGATPLRAPHRGNSDIHVHPNGKFLYAACRSPDPGVIAIFSIDDTITGKLTLVGHESVGLVPRNFKIVGDGKWLIVGNQETKTVQVFSVDADSGKLQLVSEMTQTTKPCNISWPAY